MLNSSDNEYSINIEQYFLHSQFLLSLNFTIIDIQYKTTPIHFLLFQIVHSAAHSYIIARKVESILVLAFLFAKERADSQFGLNISMFAFQTELRVQSETRMNTLYIELVLVLILIVLVSIILFRRSD